MRSRPCLACSRSLPAASVVRALEAAHPFPAVCRCTYPRPGRVAMRADGVTADRQRGAEPGVTVLWKAFNILVISSPCIGSGVLPSLVEMWVKVRRSYRPQPGNKGQGMPALVAAMRRRMCRMFPSTTVLKTEVSETILLGSNVGEWRPASCHEQF